MRDSTMRRMPVKTMDSGRASTPGPAIPWFKIITTNCFSLINTLNKLVELRVAGCENIDCKHYFKAKHGK